MCIFTPARIAFTDDNQLKWAIVDSIVDLIFLMDLVLNFFFAYYDDEYMLVDNRGAIAKNYLRSWFFIDLISIIPVQLLLGGDDYTSLARIARFPKLYRLVKITR